MQRGMQRGIMRDVMWDPMWDGLYGENVVYKSAGNPSCLVFYYH